MDRRCFTILCHLLQTRAGLESIEHVDIEEMIALFLHVLAHDVKNRHIQREFVRSGKTVSRHFNMVLMAILRLHDELLATPQPITSGCTDMRWQCFENCLGALDGTFIKVNVSAADRPRGQCYHLQKWRGAENAPETPKEFFNMKHSSARNVIERAFDLLKGRWAILRRKSYYPVQTMVTQHTQLLVGDDITNIEPSNEWTEWRDVLASSMFGMTVAMTSSSKSPKHSWTNAEEACLVDYLVDLVNTGGRGRTIMRPFGLLLKKTFQAIAEMRGPADAPCSKRTLEQAIFALRRIIVVFGKDRATGACAETFADIGSNVPTDNDSVPIEDDIDMEFPAMYSLRMNMSPEDMMGGCDSSAENHCRMAGESYEPGGRDDGVEGVAHEKLHQDARFDEGRLL
ncbi:retrotransposon protein [Cucumis melo var. makuwa]|uniref:Retrotransposon protein n=1 Tax=Cucumis melo var. makuwa TaxID=1194695 RepID=A0A5A7T069_CUCMM|nr:retrotransposon protein [Cucumis melo var. makuwa]TYK27334.1 retrotransposon protein [Cucumis melo var. makuwa]